MIHVRIWSEENDKQRSVYGVYTRTYYARTSSQALDKSMDVQALTQYLPAVRDAIQSLFFVVVGVITILTYSKATRTLLQPIRTEVFKEQVKAFAELLGYFTGKDETELRDELGFDKAFYANACAMVDSFARLFFEVEIDRDERPYSVGQCPMSSIHAKYLELLDDHLQRPSVSRPPAPDPSMKAAIWSGYDHGEIHVSRELVDAKKKFRKMLDSPLLPTRCVELGETFLATVDENLTVLQRLLVAAAKELPEKYPNRDTLQNASLDWLNTRYAKDFVELEPKAKAITAFLRQYFLTDDVLNP